MVAYSFQARCCGPILRGAKLQTIRGPRKRHARPGEALQLYAGMRTRQCRLVARATCEAVQPVTLHLADRIVRLDDVFLTGHAACDRFAQRDGFEDWTDLTSFWAAQHPRTSLFSGVLVRWLPLSERATSHA